MIQSILPAEISTTLSQQKTSLTDQFINQMTISIQSSILLELLLSLSDALLAGKSYN